MRKFKKFVSTAIIAAMAGTLCLTGCGSNSSSESSTGSSKSEKQVTVAVVQPMSHTSLDQIRDTITSELGKDDNIKVVTDNANGDTAALSSIIENYKSEGVDIVVPIATSTAQTAKSVYDGEDTPIVFAAVSDPEAAGLTGEDCANITGFLYTSSETNSVSTITAAKKYCDDNNIAYEESSISNVSELQTAVESLISKGVDALYTGNDNTIASAMATYTDAAYAKKVPIYCGADSMVADGGFATVGVNYVQLGKQVADMVEKIANGEKVSDIPYETISDYAKYVNMQAVKQFGGNFDKKAFEGFDVLVEEDGTSHFNK